ncbi:sigma-70 family RNA polymerase sigma factor, partial [Bacteroides fragilis]|uniref:sigma-70 family RNA polymerase sigma factor n=1 Tax=Bacteroides fragilis TaxID=817 RepID=UPI00051619DD
ILCAYGNRFVDNEESKEIAGDAILWLWEHRQTLPIETSLGRYLLKSVYHRSLNCIKQKKLKYQADTMFYAEMEKLIYSTEAFQFQELSKRIKDAIDALPPSYREAFLMHRFTKKSYKEIAVISEVSIKTIAYRIQQATKLLRKDLADLLITTFVCVLSIIH